MGTDQTDGPDRDSIPLRLTIEDPVGAKLAWAYQHLKQLDLHFIAFANGFQQGRYTWGGVEEADDREQLKRLQADLGSVEHRADERRIVEAIKLAQDVPLACDAATPARRKQLAWTVFETSGLVVER